jgi:hypothetical protein
MDNFTTLCCIGALLVIGLLALPLLRRGMAGASNSRTRLEPTYDDEDIRSRGAFGRAAGGVRPQYDDDRIESRGFFGRSRPVGTRQSTTSRTRRLPSLRRRTNSENIRSRGSFGRSKGRD